MRVFLELLCFAPCHTMPAHVTGVRAHGHAASAQMLPQTDLHVSVVAAVLQAPRVPGLLTVNTFAPSLKGLCKHTSPVTPLSCLQWRCMPG